ncbi:MAG TPA: hypothetical protein VKY26_09405 [Actinomycetota bacterium]|nr:hypothetical protein [Actinomycetota bacterium]
MDNRAFDRLAAWAAMAVALLSLVYAVGYLFVAPAAQRKNDVDAFYRSYLAHPDGMRIAATCLLVSGIIIGLPLLALSRRLAAAGPLVSWGAIIGVVSGFATAAHGLSSLIGTDRLAHSFATADAATHPAIVLAHAAPSAIDPAGLATFGVTGLAALAFGVALRGARKGLGTLGIALGIDLVALFLANAVGSTPLVLLTGGLASVVLGPIWYVSLGRLLLTPAATAPAA